MTTLKKYFGVNNPNVVTYTKEQEDLVNPNLIIGLELETENCDSLGGDWVGKMDGMNFNVERDGSLRGVAYEFISRPMASQTCPCST